MSKDYREILSGKVEEVKEEVDDLDSPDFEKLLKLEREGKDRKTVKEYLEDLQDQAGEAAEEVQDEAEEAAEEAEETVEEVEEEIDEELDSDDVEVTNPDTESFVDSVHENLNALSPVSLIGLGLIIGLLAGTAASQVLTSNTYEASPAAVSSDMQTLLSGPNSTVDLGNAEKQHGMYYFNATITQQTANGTQTNNREFYVTSDGELLFPKLQVPLLGLRTPIEVESALNPPSANATN